MFKKDKLIKYSIKKITIGAASVIVGSILFLGSNAYANDENSSIEVNKNQEVLIDSIKDNFHSEKSTVKNEDQTTKREVILQNSDAINKEEAQQNVKKDKIENSKEIISYANVLDKRVDDSTNVKDLLTKIINENNNPKKEESAQDDGGQLPDGIISKLTSEYAEKLAKGYIGLEGAKYDNLLYENTTLNPEGDDDHDGILNKDELYIYRKNGRTYLGYNAHPKLIDTDGDGIIDSEDNDKLLWNISARDMALFMNLAYQNDNTAENILMKNVPEGILKTNIQRMQNNELSPYWKIKKTYHENDTANGFDAILFETNDSYPFFNGEKIQILAIAGTDVKEFGDLKADASLFLGGESNQSLTTKELIKALEEDKSITNLYITGHSLGGYLSLRAAAQATSDKMSSLREVYTFNAPKIKSGIFGSDAVKLAYERNLTDDMAKKGLIKNYYTENDNVIFSSLRPDNKISIGNSSAKHGSASYFETRMNDNSDFNIGIRQGVDGIGHIDANIKKLKIIGPKNGTLASTFLPRLIDNNPISIMLGENIKDKDILSKIDKDMLPVNISLSIIERADLSTLGSKNMKIKVLYLDDNTENDILVPILVNEVNKDDLSLVVNNIEKITLPNGNDELKKELQEAKDIINNKTVTYATTKVLTKNLAKITLDLINKQNLDLSLVTKDKKIESYTVNEQKVQQSTSSAVVEKVQQKNKQQSPKRSGGKLVKSKNTNDDFVWRRRR